MRFMQPVRMQDVIPISNWERNSKNIFRTSEKQKSRNTKVAGFYCIKEQLPFTARSTS
jgi:hypothetical protein